MNKIQQICLFCSGFVVLILIFGTAIVFVSGKAKPENKLHRTSTAPTVSEKKSQSAESIFSYIGPVRCITADNPPVPLVLTIYFPYASGDTAFYEELFQKTGKIRRAVASYMGRYTQKELLQRGEQKLKSDLTDLINSELVLGKIKRLYFSDYIFLE